MRNLINFLLRNSSWFVLIFLEIICFYFIFSSNSYQKSVFLNSSNEISGKVYSVSGNILSYFGLRQENQELLLKNAELQSQVSNLKNHLYEIENDSLKTEAFLEDSLHQRKEYEYIISRVINNSVSQAQNYITIDKGSNDGVKEDMGVISQQGIVGVVRAVSNNFAVIQPVLNPNSKFSCKILNSNTPGTLIWDGEDPRYASLTDYPKFEKFEVGDSIITSGFSGIFPEGIFVGVVEDYVSQSNDNFYSLKIKLSTDFSSLKNVLLIKNSAIEEKYELEKKVQNAKK
ncbi:MULTISPECIES: rod shape-determining protein MreC [unclassified Dysgonomonas]|uniref:rod shape-determining protein MreC n=1 Tax=unclassified Dysgonomonas TaxID=2630389 RepID=UPI0013EC8015|nr:MULTISPECIES: rod shape-determining protein MreC [unclassified Dysgonomonas]